MLLEIKYKIQYTYTDPVFLESNEIRIFPRNDMTQKILHYKLEIMPTPSNKTFFIDKENNTALKLWFNDLTDSFSLDFSCRVETLRTNPYDFIVDFDKTKLPYIQIKTDSALKAFSDKIRTKADNDVLGFLSQLSIDIKNNFKYKIRENGHAKPAEQTLTDKSGACRDFAVLFMEACKLQGLETRFVSGYMFDKDNRNSSHLHAWAEVFIPGGGWKGYDPVNGFAVSEHYIPVAASTNPANVLPIIGNYRSNQAKQIMKYYLRINAL